MSHVATRHSFCGGIFDYVYHTLWKCRKCGTWLAFLLLLLVAPSLCAQAPQTPLQTIDQIDALLKTLRAQVGPPPPVVTSVSSGGDVSAAIAAAPAGATIKLLPGGVYAAVTIARSDIKLVGAEGPLALPTPASSFPKVTGLDHLLTLKDGATNLDISGIEWAGVGGGADLITELRGAHDIKFHHNYVHGDAIKGQKRGIALFGGAMDMDYNYIADIKRTDQDTQAIASYDGTGPYNIRHNYLEASGENVIFGGDDPSTLNLVPCDILIDDNTITKPIAWRTMTPPWLVKNLLELKNACRVTITNNRLSNSWKSGQDGYAIVLTVRNQSNTCPWCNVTDVLIRSNSVMNASGGVNILGRDDKFTSGVMARVTIDQNDFSNLNRSVFGGDGKAMLIQGGPIDLHVTNNSFAGAPPVSPLNSFLSFGQLKFPLLGFVYTGNTAQHGVYGIAGDTIAPGLPTLNAYAPGLTWDKNIVSQGAATRCPRVIGTPYPAGCADTVVYPTGTVIVP